MDIGKFIADNNLTQEVLAQYLGVNKSTVCRMVSGEVKLTEAHRENLIHNPRGWDVSSLLLPTDPKGRYMPTWKEQMYEDMIRERDEKIMSLQERLYKLMYKKDGE